MVLLYHIIAVVCVGCIASGQILFKSAALAMAASTDPGRYLNVAVLAGGGVFIYGLATIGWIYILQHLPLSKIYPYMGFSFIAVPMLSVYLFSERLAWGDFIGMSLITLGILVTAIFGFR